MNTKKTIRPIKKRKTWRKPLLQAEKIQKTGEMEGNDVDDYGPNNS